jgi:DNA-directed RNA polymerase specialized sigma24 family protein
MLADRTLLEAYEWCVRCWEAEAALQAEASALERTRAHQAVEAAEARLVDLLYELSRLALPLWRGVQYCGGLEEAQAVLAGGVARMLSALRRQRPQFESDAEILGYAKKSVQSAAVDPYRRRDRLPVTDLTVEREDGTREELELPDPDPATQPETAAGHREILAEVAAEVNTWQPEERTVFLLRVREVPSRTVAELVNALNPGRNPPMTAGNVDVIYHRCRERLRRKLGY